jgi:3-hydroxyacyl-[acyl-carrier-protein] dehydratase
MTQYKEIEQLIPHRAPFLFIDEITSIKDNKITGHRTFDRSEQTLTGENHNFVPAVIVLESMVQCGGAGVKKMGLTEGLFGLAHIENAEFFEEVHFGQKVHYEVVNYKVTSKYVKQTGKAYVDDKVILEATWLCVRLE